MKKQKSYNRILDIDENFNFVEEVSDEEVEEYQFDDPKEDKKHNLIIIIISLLSLSLFFGGLYYAFIRPILNKGEGTTTNSDLYGIYPTVKFGEEIQSFTAHASFQNASTYKFRIENRNEHALSYKLKIIEKEVKSKTKIAKSDLHFMIIKNNNMLNEGVMSNIDGIISETTIKAKGVDEYQLKFWATAPIDKYFSYSIEIVE